MTVANIQMKKAALHCWYFPTLEHADAFAKRLCHDSRRPVVVAERVALWEPTVTVRRRLAR